MEWLIFGLVCWAVVRFLGINRCGAARGRWEHRRMPAARREPALPQAPAPAESAEQRLRRQYVEGTLTVEQYERELDRLYRARP